MMRKLLCLLLALLIVSAGTISLVFARVNDQNDQVTFTETVVSGDKSVAEGLTILSRSSYLDRLHWDTTYVIGEQPITDTAYRFTTDYEVDRRRDLEKDAFHLHTHVDGGFMEGEKDPVGISRAYQELYDSMEPGEEKEIEIYLKDYYDYYPFYGNVELPGLFLHMDSGDYRRNYMEQEEIACAEALEAFFRIPILEDDKELIMLGLDETGNVWTSGGGSISGDDFFVDFWAPYTDDAVYIAFDAHTTNQKLVDTSLIPGGFGIYRLPYYEREQPDTLGNSKALDYDQLTMVYPLDPETYINRLTLSETGEELLLHTWEQESGAFFLTVIDIATMEMLQKLEVNRDTEGNWAWRFFPGEGFLAFTFYNDTRLVVAQRQENGTYTLEFSVPLSIGEEGTPYADQYLNDRCAIAYDGEKLAIADLLSVEYANASGEYYWHTRSCSFYTAVYDRTGMIYFGTYESSLSAGENYSDEFHECSSKNDPLFLRWS